MKVDLRVIAASPSEKGDVLTTLVRDLFFVLGYDECRLNVHKTGREIDVIAKHRYEPRDLIAECKNQAKPIGGDDTNKFAGVLGMERDRRADRQTHGYFISLSGFKESAIEQEMERGQGPRFVMMDDSQVAQELIAGGIVVRPHEAIGVALSVTNSVLDSAKFDNSISLIGSPAGWMWIVGIDVAGSEPYYCLVQADGRPALPHQARSLQEMAGVLKDPLAIRHLVNDLLVPDRETEDLQQRYRHYLLAEFGHITLEGLPADQDVHSKPFRLESLYVPLALRDLAGTDVMGDSDPEGDSFADPQIGEEDGDGDGSYISADEYFEEDYDDEDDEVEDEDEDEDLDIEPSEPDQGRSKSLGAALRKHVRLAILGLPGSGKTTLLKRLAVAYSDPARLRASDDDLPEDEYFPVLLRCRTLRGNARQPIVALLASQIEQAEIIGETAKFGQLVQQKLAQGKLLLLVDGLDEIVSPSDRAAFVAQLRTFVAMYPTCRIVVTSRVAGFRAVAGAVQAVCDAVQVQNLGPEAIRELTVHWHKEVIGSSASVQADANRLADTIVRTDRIRRLAVNPLLLTTLLLVKRWVGQLPRKRTMLYQKAVEVLLMTWNAEGHEPLDPEETMPQLGYAAFVMLSRGATTVTADELAEHFTNARRSLPEVLGYARVSVHKLTERVEERSSLLTLSGHKLVDGEIKPTYAFKHLTFQEYFAALAIINGWLPRELQDLSYVQVLGPRLGMSAWQEVVALTAVLSGKKASQIVRALLDGEYLDVRGEKTEIPVDSRRRRVMQPRSLNVIACLADEAPIAPSMAEEAIRFCIGAGSAHELDDLLPGALHGGRYDPLARKILFEQLQDESEGLSDAVSALSGFAVKDLEASCADETEWDSWIGAHLRSAIREERITGAAALMEIAYGWRSYGSDDFTPFITSSVEIAMEEVDKHPEDPVLAFAYVWALAWAARKKKPSPDRVGDFHLKLARVWLNARTVRLSRFCAWAIYALPLPGQWDVDEDFKTRVRELAERNLGAEGDEAAFLRKGAMVLMLYVTPENERGALVEVALDRLSGQYRKFDDLLPDLLPAMGEEGRVALVKLQEERAVRREAARQRRRRNTPTPRVTVEPPEEVEVPNEA